MAAAKRNETVILLHGILRSDRSMAKIAKLLKRQGYDVVNIHYPSRKYRIEKLIDLIHPEIVAAQKLQPEKIHMIGHSMGNLLIRAYINKYKPQKLGNVVMLAPPNHGSEVADFWMNIGLYKWIFGPAGQQLGTDQTDLLPILGEVDYTVGVIAADWNNDPISAFMLPKGNDGKVSIASTKLAQQTDHIVMHGTHSFLMYQQKVIDQAIYFLQNSQFQHAVN